MIHNYTLHLICLTPAIALDKINLCILDLSTWMIKHKLKINDSKTEFMVLITSSFLTQQFNDLQI